MTRIARIQPINSIIFIHGGGDIEVPAEKIERSTRLVVASRDCLIVCVNPEVDGPTELTIGTAAAVDPGRPPDHTAVLLARRRRLIIDQVDEHVIHDQIVASTTPTIRFWFSHPEWPERVLIGIE